MNKCTLITIRIVLFLTVVFALYLYFPFADRIVTTLINIQWHNSSGTITAGNSLNGSATYQSDVLIIILHLALLTVGFFVLPGIFLFYMWQLTKKVKPYSSQTLKSRRGRRGRKHRTIAGIDEKLLLNAYNQLQHIEAAIDAKVTKIKEELGTELREEIRSMVDKKRAAEDCMEKVRTLYKSAKYEEALAACNKVIELSPSGRAYYIRGVLHHKLALDDAAMDNLKTAAKLGYQKAQEFLATKGVSYYLSH